LAKELIEKYLVSKNGTTEMYKKDPRVPARQDVITALEATDPDLHQFLNSAKNGIPMPNVPEMSSVWNAVGSSIKLIVTKKETPAASLKQAKAQIDAALAKK
jgi:maltose/maltodextrin transport system substrate-binding protein